MDSFLAKIKSNKYIILLIVIIAALAYSRTTENDFVHWDDNNQEDNIFVTFNFGEKGIHLSPIFHSQLSSFHTLVVVNYSIIIKVQKDLFSS